MRTYYGYSIVDGELVVIEEEKEKIKSLFQTYLSGCSIAKAGCEAGISGHHSTLGRILSNRVYLGTEDYPRIIEDELFNQVQEKRQIRKDKLGHNFKAEEKKLNIPTAFTWIVREEVYEDAYSRASGLFDQIEVRL